MPSRIWTELDYHWISCRGTQIGHLKYTLSHGTCFEFLPSIKRKLCNVEVPTLTLDEMVEKKSQSSCGKSKHSSTVYGQASLLHGAESFRS
jgi:hypothetical protein